MTSYIERIRGSQPSATVIPIATNAARRPVADGIHPYAAAAIDYELTRLDNLPRPWAPNSYWDTTTFEVACNLIEIANSHWSGYTLADAERDLYDRAPADSAWGRREHEQKWRSAGEKIGAGSRPEPAPQQEWTVPDVTVLEEAFADGANATAGDLDVGALVREKFPTLDFVHLLGTDDDGEEWIVEPILPARRLVALYSAPKVGKSLLMLEIAVGIALGREVIGVVPDPRKVLYVDFENDPRGDVKRRLEAMGFGPEDGAALNQGLCYLSFPSIAKLDTPQGGYEILTTAREYGCEVVVIDTVSRAVGGEENDNDTWLAFYRNTGMPLKGAGIACIRLDHSGKDAEKGMRGGSAKYGDVDAVWKLTTEAAGSTVLELVCTDHRMPIEIDRMTIIRDSSPVLRHRSVGGDRTLALDARETEIDRALDDLGIPTTASVRTVKKALRDAGFKYSNPGIERVAKNRKLRLPEVSPGHLGDTRGHPVGPPPVPVSLKGDRGGTSPSRRGRLPEDGPEDGPEEHPRPVERVSCQKCFAPTPADFAETHFGRCPNCSREEGLA